jgi:endonuclease/exonuclease/phosphatase (EEP) superfamily protein YafD
MFVRKGIEVKAEGSYEIFKITDDLGLPEDIKIWNRLLQYITVPYKNSEITIFNLHGLYTGGGKGDGIARLEQSRKVSNFMRNHRGSKILCGDFNLNPETESIKIFEEGMVNLIKEKGIVSTRSHIYSGDNKYADYIFTSPDVAVLHFEVLQDTVSDHLPLYIEF